MTAARAQCEHTFAALLQLGYLFGRLSLLHCVLYMLGSCELQLLDCDHTSAVNKYFVSISNIHELWRCPHSWNLKEKHLLYAVYSGGFQWV